MSFSVDFISSSKLRFFAFVVTAAINLYIYYPSFHHIARGDQWCYFFDTADTNKISSLILNSYSYNRQRICHPGDVFLFRPLVFIFLGFEKWLFDFEFLYWQIVGIVLHLIVIWWLLKLLFYISPTVIAFIFTLFFSTLHITQYMVIWQHLHGYLIFLIFTLISTYYLLIYIKEGQKLKHILIISVCAFIMCFTHEIGIFWTFLFLIYIFACSGKDKFLSNLWQNLLLLLPIGIYILLNIWDYTFRGNFYPILKEMSQISRVSSFAPSKAIYDFFAISSKFFSFALLPTTFILLSPGIGVRIFLGEAIINPYIFIMNFAVAIFLIVRIVELISIDKKKLKFIFLLFGMFVSLVGMLVVGRTLGRGIKYILYESTYYAYPIWLILSIIFYILIDPNKVLNLWNSNYKKLSLIIASCILIFINSYNVRVFNEHIEERERSAKLFVKELKKFVDKHKNEKDFSFGFLEHPAEDFCIPIYQLKIHKKFYFIEKNKFHISEILYSSYINKFAPKYYLRYQNGKLFYVKQKRKMK